MENTDLPWHYQKFTWDLEQLCFTRPADRAGRRTVSSNQDGTQEIGIATVHILHLFCICESLRDSLKNSLTFSQYTTEFFQWCCID